MKSKAGILIVLFAAGVDTWSASARSHGSLVVSPTESVNLVSLVGQNPETTTIVYRLTNPGRGVLRWTAATDQDWVRVSPSAGMVRPKRQAELTIELSDVSLFRVGTFPIVIEIADNSGESIAIRRSIVLKILPGAVVALPAPHLELEPAFTRGTTNSVEWPRVPGANEYRVEASASSDFANAISSGWIRRTNHMFQDLRDGVAYSFRVQCRSNSSVWSQTLPDHFATNENFQVSARTQPGDIVLDGNTNRSWFENFEAPAWTNTIFTDLSLGAPQSHWQIEELDPATLASDTEPPLPINQHGDREGRLFDVIGWHRYAYMLDTPGNTTSNLTVDAILSLGSGPQSHILGVGVVLRADPRARLTNGFLGGNGYVGYIQEDGSAERLLSIMGMTNGILHHRIGPEANRFPIGESHENYHVRFTARGPELTLSAWRLSAVDGVIVESPVQLGNGANVQTIHDTTYSRGVVGLMGIAWSDVNAGTSSVFFDDVTIVAHDGPAHYTPRGSSVAAVTPPLGFDRWGALNFSETHTSSGRLTVDILNGRGDLVLTSVANGTDLGAQPAVARLGSLRLRANFASDDPEQTPSLQDWTVRYQLPATNLSESEWSAPATSTQDNQPPIVQITSPPASPMTTTNRFLALEGTAFDPGAGVAEIRISAATGGAIVRFYDATTTNGFADWTLSGDILRPGTNVIRLTARDRAVPPNVTTASLIVVYTPAPLIGLARAAAEGDGKIGMIITPVESTTAATRLAITVINGQAVVSWPPTPEGFILETANLLSSPEWAPLDDVSSPIAYSIQGQSRFFRIRLR